MYTYYEMFNYKSGHRTKCASYYSNAYYTHKVTVYENCNEKKYKKLRDKFGSHKVSCVARRLKSGTAKVYVRETLRVAKLKITTPTHQYYSKMREVHSCKSENFGLKLSVDIGK